MRFIVIYSDGPCGSSNLASLLEKYGFINLPIRKLHFSEYLMGSKSLSDKSMQMQVLTSLKIYSNPVRLGGLSVKDRNSRGKIRRYNKPTQDEIDNFLLFEPKSIKSLLVHCFTFASKFVVYKDIISKPKGIIIHEMPQFVIKHEFTEKEYINKLIKSENISFFVLSRDFKSWCAALLSQQDSKLGILSRLNFVSLEKLYLRWLFIQNLGQDKNISEIKLNDILLPNTKKTIDLLQKKLNLEPIIFNKLVKEEFDIFGSIIKFKEAFTPSDLSLKKSNFLAYQILKNYPKFPKLLRNLLDYLFNSFRLIRLFRF
tara:strand:+ start:355 stop:1296 length:942 start_codon:yes stop_codon:yes gene_type:complete